MNAPIRRVHSAITNQRVEEAFARLHDEHDPASVAVLGFLKSRGFHFGDFLRFRPMPSRTTVHVNEKPILGLPWMDAGRCVMVRQFSVPTYSDSADVDWRSTRSVTSGNSRYKSLYNVDAVRGRPHVIICGDEFDCMALWHFLSRADYMSPPVAAFPLPHVSDEMLEDLLSAETITLWMDDTPQGKAQTESLTSRLGSHRIRLAEIPQDVLDAVMEAREEQPINAQDCLRLGVSKADVLSILRNAKASGETPTVLPSHYRISIQERIQGGAKALGIPMPDEGLAGTLLVARNGDITWVSGQTKHGKTSKMTEWMVKFAKAGHKPVGAFMEGNGGQVVTDNMHQRIIGKPLMSLKTDGEREAAMRALDGIDDLPMRIIPLRGMHKVDVIADHFKHAVEVEGCKVGFWDHFSQIEPANEYMGRDIRAHTDRTIHVIEKLFAERLRIPLFLGGHPSKIDPNVIPTARSGMGGASIMQVVSGSVSVWRPEGIPGYWSQRKIKVTPDGWQEMTVTMNHNSILLVCTLKRAPEAQTGHWFETFDRQSLRTTYTGQSCPTLERVQRPEGKPLDDEPEPQWTAKPEPTHAEATHVED